MIARDPAREKPADRQDRGSPSARHRRQKIGTYLFAVAIALCTLGLRLLIGARLEGPTFIIFTVPIIFSAYLGGLGSGLLATGTVVVGACYYLLPPLHSFAVASPTQRWQLAILIVTGGLISVICEALRRAQARAEANAIEARSGQEKLGESEARYRTLFEYAPEGIVIADQQSYYLDANASMCRMLGYTREEFIGLHASDIVVPAEVPHIGSALSALQARSDYRREWRFRRKDGSVFAAEVIATKMPDGNLLGVIRDITERQRGEARLRRLVDSNAQGVMFWNTQGEISEANDAFLGLVGYTREDLAAGRINWAAMTPPEYAVLDERALTELAAKGVCTPFEKEYLRKDGTRVPILIGAALFEDSPGEGVCFVLDITERRRAEEILRTTQVRLNSALAAGSIGTWSWDIGRDWLTADEFTARAFSIEVAAAAQGLPAAAYLQAVVAEDQAAVADSLAEAIRTCGHYDIEYRVRQKADGLRWLQARGRVEGDATGKAVFFHGAVVDITARKLAETSVRASEGYFRFLNDLAVATRPLADPAQIMAITARMLGRHLGASRCAYADVEPDGEGFTILHDYTDGCASTVGHYQLSLFGPRAVATLHAGQTLIIRNVETELSSLEGADMFKAIGIRAIITCPLVKEGGLRAMMAVHQAVARDWQPAEITLVEDVVERCWATLERRRAEEKIRQLNVDLEQRVAERTTQLEAANAELRSGRAELKSLFESLPGLYLVLGLDLKIVAVSDAYLKATLTTREGIIGRDLFEVFPDNPGDPGTTAEANMRASLGRVIKQAAPDTMAIQKHDVRRPDGVFEERYWSPINSPMFEADRRIKYIIHRVEEVTDFVRHSQLHPAGHRVEPDTRVQQMEAEIFQSSLQLQETNRQLEAANGELEAFSYSVSHDLRAPLRAVDGFSQAVIEDFGPQLPEEGRRQLQVIRESAQRMGALIDDLLAFSRLSRLPLRRHAVQTGALVSEVVAEQRALTAGRSVEINVGELPVCHGDRALLKQVWLNLLSNALKYSGKRAHAVVEIGCTEQKGERVFFVRDNGSGFDMRYAGKLFGVFQRLHRTEEYAGTGVGLAIVQRIVHRHGGRIWAEAALDQGATFYFTLQGETKP